MHLDNSFIFLKYKFLLYPINVHTFNFQKLSQCDVQHEIKSIELEDENNKVFIVVVMNLDHNEVLIEIILNFKKIA